MTGNGGDKGNIEDLTAEQMVLSETTFEKDTRVYRLPVQITTLFNCNNNTEMEDGKDGVDDDDDNITLYSFLPETTFEADQQMKQEQ